MRTRSLFRRWDVGVSLRRYLRALADWLAALRVWVVKGAGWMGLVVARRVREGLEFRRAERQEGQ